MSTISTVRNKLFGIWGQIPRLCAREDFTLYPVTLIDGALSLSLENAAQINNENCSLSPRLILPANNPRE